MELTDKEIRGAKFEGKQYTLSDGDGLLLRVQKGGKSWILRYWIDNKEKRAGLGPYPEIGLKDARDRKNQFKRELALTGVNPLERKRQEKEAAAKAQAEAQVRATTFKTVAEDWFAQQSEVWSEQHILDTRRRLDKYILPTLGERPIVEIKTQEVLTMIRYMEEWTIATAKKCKEHIGQILRYAIGQGIIEYDVTANLRGVLKPKTIRNFAAITRPSEVADMITRIEAYHGSPVVKEALWFSLYTFQRPGEIRHAEWQEIDLASNLWRLPAEKMKTRKEHLVPLASQVVAILERIQPWTGDSRYIFPTIKSRQIPMSENTIRVALRSMGYTKEQMTSHGFRSTASSILHEQGWPSDDIERCLAHTVGNAVQRTYDRSERLAERRTLMQHWADWLDSLKEEKLLNSKL